MDHLVHNIGTVDQGSLVRVDINGPAANVFLVDDHNYARYRRGDSFRYTGGHYRHTPVRLATPATGRWNVVVDLGGRAGRIGATVTVGGS